MQGSQPARDRARGHSNPVASRRTRILKRLSWKTRVWGQSFIPLGEGKDASARQGLAASGYPICKDEHGLINQNLFGHIHNICVYKYLFVCYVSYVEIYSLFVSLREYYYDKSFDALLLPKISWNLFLIRGLSLFFAVLKIKNSLLAYTQDE